MLIRFEDRPSDSPVVERVWRSHSERAGAFLSNLGRGVVEVLAVDLAQDFQHLRRRLGSVRESVETTPIDDHGPTGAELDEITPLPLTQVASAST